MKRTLFTGVFSILFVLMAFSQKNAKPIIASNNFTDKSDLWESIGLGIINYQADVMYIYGKLYVTPLMPDSANHKLPTLTDAYLFPLFNQFKKNNGEILPGYTGDIFLILNFSTQPVQIYKKLAAEMRPFSDMLTFKIDGNQHQGKLRILIKDNTQFEMINSIKPSFLGLVGNLSDIDKNIDSEKMPLIEVNFYQISSWKGIGNIPFEDYVRFKEIVTKVHAQKKKLSLVNCPTHKAIAELIKTSNADFVSTSESAKMAGFFETLK